MRKRGDIDFISSPESKAYSIGFVLIASVPGHCLPFTFDSASVSL